MKMTGKKIATIVVLVVVGIGAGLIGANALLDAPFNSAIRELENTPGVMLIKETGNPNGVSGRARCEWMANHMDNWCYEETIDNLGTGIVYDYTSYIHPETSLTWFISELKDGIRTGTLLNTARYNPDLKIIYFMISEPQSNLGGTTFFVTDYYLYFN